jgi:hypothetical protein
MDDLEQRNAPPPSLTEAAFGYLKTAGPWMFFLGILSVIVCGISFLSGIVLLANNTLLNDLNAAGIRNGGAFLGFFHVALSIISFFPARFLFLAGSKLRILRPDDSNESLEAALRNNASFWKFYGLICIAGIAITVMIVVGIIIIAIRATGSV